MKRKIAYSLIVFLLLFVLFEIAIRYFWGGPIKITEQKWGAFNVALDPVLGYKCMIGKNVFANQNGEYFANCNENGRLTALVEDINANKKKIYFYGCSFTFGHGLPDSLTFAWKLQKILPDDKVFNFGYEGYGVSQFYAQALQHIKSNPPEIMIINYANFQNGRNMLFRNSRRNAFYYQTDKTILNQIRFPVLMVEQHKIKMEYIKFRYRYPFPFVTKLASFNFIDVMVSNAIDNLKKPNKITIEAFKDIDKQCKAKGITLIINGIVDDKATKQTLMKLSQSNIITSNIFVDLNDENLLLEDHFHPNELANSKLAIEFKTLLSKWIDTY
jgi:hypothetical protein